MVRLGIWTSVSASKIFCLEGDVCVSRDGYVSILTTYGMAVYVYILTAYGMVG